MIVDKNLKPAAVRTAVVPRPRPTEATDAVFVLKASFWATSLPLSPKLCLWDDRFELVVPHLRRCVIHHVHYDDVHAIELVEGRFFTDVVFHCADRTELVAPGLRNKDLAPATDHLAQAIACPLATTRA